MKFNWRNLVLSGVVATGAIYSAGIADAQPKAPTRVLALSTTNVEIIGELGKSSTIVGIDRSAKHLKFPYLDKLPDFGHPYQPNIEGILSLKPQLVLANKENLKPASAEQLRAKVPVTILEESYKDGIAGLKRHVTAVANIYREPAKGKAINARIDAQMRQLNAKVTKAKKKPKIFFLYAHGLGDAYVYGRDTGSDVLIRLSGGVNAADFTTGTKPLTAEAMVQAAPMPSSCLDVV